MNGRRRSRRRISTCVFKHACVKRWPSQAGWLHWFRRPVLAAALTVIMGVGIGLFLTRDNGRVNPAVAAADLGPGSAVSDLQTLDKNQDLYADFELLDDLDLQQNVAPSPQNTDNTADN